MNKITTIAIFALLLVPISALADTQTHSIKDMYSVKVAHVGDTIVVTNNDNVLHSITGKDNRGDVIDYKLAPGDTINLQFMFPVNFAYYDKYDKNLFGSLYTFEPSTDLTQMNVYNHTSISDLYEKPQYVEGTASAPANVMTSDNATTLGNTTSQVQVAPSTQSVASVPSNTTTTSSGTLSFGFSNSTKLTVATPDNSTLAEMKQVISLQQTQIDNYKTQLDVVNKQLAYWENQASQWQTVAERLAEIVQSLQ